MTWIIWLYRRVLHATAALFFAAATACRRFVASAKSANIRHRAASLAFATALSACSAIDVHRAPPADWPQLKRQTLRVSVVEANCLCGGNLLLMMPNCAFVDFKARVCTKIIARQAEPQYAEEHEEMHCRGYDHVGASSGRDAWRVFKETGEVPGSRYVTFASCISGPVPAMEGQ
jgi:hypothetical protein